VARAAIELFTTQGYHATTTPMIAQHAGVAEGTIYRHFTSKHQLLNELYRAGVRALTTPIKTTDRPERCRDHLAFVARSWCDLAGRDPGAVKLVFFMHLEGLLDPKSRDLFAGMKQGLKDVIVSGKARGELRPGAVEVWSEVWLTLLLLGVQRIISKEWGARDQRTDLVLEAAWEAIRAGAGGDAAYR
jgi:AcrR family transcriptional regulator